MVTAVGGEGADSMGLVGETKPRDNRWFIEDPIGRGGLGEPAAIGCDGTNSMGFGGEAKLKVIGWSIENPTG